LTSLPAREVLSGAMLVLVACGGGGATTASSPTTPPATTESPSPSPPPSPECQPTGSALQVTAKEKKFDATCLAAPADAPFTIAFTNQDNVLQHNVAITTTDGDHLFDGDVIGHKAITYHVDAFEAGVYEFQCNIHPNEMRGQFVAA
jgi:plastocyanin